MEKIKEFKVGDRVGRKKETDYRCNEGTIKTIDEYDRCYILWDEKAGKYGISGIGQQHSTINNKFLKHL